MTNPAPLLLVEDDDNDAFFFQRAMNKADFQLPLRVAKNAKEAVDYLSGFGIYADRAEFPLPHLVVLDLNLPGQTGLEILRWIREKAQDPLVPVIILSASTSERDLVEAYRSGANSFLSKPSQSDGLVGLVRALKEYWFGYNRFPPR
jgi:DNA-binding response OmpR family regulator